MKKNSRASTPDVITPSTAASPPPLSVSTHGKVDSKAAKSLPPPPMNGDDMKPPTMNGSTKKATKKATPKSGKTSLAKKVVPDEDWIEDPVKSASKRKLLFALFLVVAWAFCACSSVSAADGTALLTIGSLTGTRSHWKPSSCWLT